MKIKTTLFLVLMLAMGLSYAQETKPLNLQEAVSLALGNSTEIKISDSKVLTAENELNVIKNNQYPDFKLSGQYMYLTNVDMNLKYNTGSTDSGSESSGATPSPNRLALGMATLTQPIFSGFQIKNAIKAGEQNYEAEVLMAKNDKEQIALAAINGYINLYKATQTVSLIEENLKSAHQRVVDFKNMEDNGLLAKNDRLKAELQEANIQIALDEAIKTRYMINYQLLTLLKLPPNTTIETSDADFGIAQSNPSVSISRFDVQAMEMQKQAAESQVKIAKAKYYPSIYFSGGYIAADIQDFITITNAMNFGVGISYNISDIFKAKSHIKAAKSKAQTLEYSIEHANEQINIQVENARQNYQLALKKLTVYTKSEEQATENYRIVKDKYDNGLQDTNDLLEADVQKLQSKIDLANAQADITRTYYEFLNTQGRLTSNLN
ncbi:transporter [Neptunitalea chrysea]|uniref:Transporter n=1 Tax=Neptunitalea chrysea TaxID=1647581 RepID=A0A9W6ETK1_9FLAO|nr:TolC family protein [Neptunitalea chrysea]GLB52115.1 transporter [Neptunitalea chrysea]